MTDDTAEHARRARERLDELATASQALLFEWFPTASPWSYTDAVVTLTPVGPAPREEPSRLRHQLWVREAAAAMVISDMDDRTIVGTWGREGDLLERYVELPLEIIRQESRPDLVRRAVAGAFEPIRTRAFPPDVQQALDAGRLTISEGGLLSRVEADDCVTSWEYHSVEQSEFRVPGPLSLEDWPWEHYRYLTFDTLAAVLGESVPGKLEDHAFAEAFQYASDQEEFYSVNAIWTSPDGSEVELVVHSRGPDSVERGNVSGTAGFDGNARSVEVRCDEPWLLNKVIDQLKPAGLAEPAEPLPSVAQPKLQSAEWWLGLSY